MAKYTNYTIKEHSAIDLSQFRRITPSDSRKALQSSETPSKLQIVIHLKPKSQFENGNANGSINRGEHMRLEEFHHLHAANENHLTEVIHFAEHFGLEVLSSSLQKRTVVVTGSFSQLENAFNVSIHEYQDGDKTFLSHSNEVGFPEEIAGFIDDVVGFNTKELKRPSSNALLSTKPREKHEIEADDTGTITPYPDGFSGAQVADLYNFPSADGAGQTIGIIELGGGYSDSDLDTYFTEINVDRPKVIESLVAGAKNASDPKFDGEVMLDIEVVGAVVPKSTLVVYFAPNSHAGFIQALQAAIHDDVNKPSVISISWGLPEKFWSKSNLSTFEKVLQDAAALGITICASSGDQGATDGETGLNVQYPSSSASVLSCGGTSITVENGAISEEEVWQTWAGSTGGGFSQVFDVPDFQKTVILSGIISPLTNRGVPDVAGSANAWAGYYILVDGQKTEKGGTSAVSPLWSGLIARMNQLLGKRLGKVHTEFYALNNTDAFNQITQGGNGTYNGGSPWNPCTGLGSPNGTALFNKLKESLK